MIKIFEIGHFASSIVWWLNYIIAVGRDYVISESALKIPAAEYLEKSEIKDIELEYPHPSFLLKKCDLYFYNPHSTTETVFELKYVKKDSTRAPSEQQRIFDDLMRLYFFLDKNKTGYFLICGNQKDFNISFRRLSLKPSYLIPKTKTRSSSIISPDFYSEWFSFDFNNPDKIIDLNTSDTKYKSIYDNFLNNYSDPYYNKLKIKLTLPNHLTTKLVFLSQEMSSTKIPQTIQIGIWEVAI